MPRDQVTREQAVAAVDALLEMIGLLKMIVGLEALRFYKMGITGEWVADSGAMATAVLLAFIDQVDNE